MADGAEALSALSRLSSQDIVRPVAEYAIFAAIRASLPALAGAVARGTLPNDRQRGTLNLKTSVIRWM